MDLNTSSQEAGKYMAIETIARQSSDRDSATGLITYSVHTVDEVRIGDKLMLGDWQHYDVALTPDVVEELCKRMGVTLEQLQKIGSDYSDMLRAIVDYKRNPPQPPAPPELIGGPGA